MDTIFQIESFDIFKNVLQEMLSSLYYSGKNNNVQFEPEMFEKAKYEMRMVISDCMFDKQNIFEALNSKGWDQEKLEHLHNLIEKNWSDLLGTALNHYNSTYGETLINFDWLVKYVLGTSELKTLQYPLLQLILLTVNKSGQQNKIMYDINKDMLLKLINELESI